MPDEPQEQEGLSEEEQAAMAEYEAAGDLGLEEGQPQEPPEVVAEEPEQPEPEPIKVPLHELKEERRKRQEAEQRLTVLMDRTNHLLGQIQQATAPEAMQPPDREEDPVGYLTWQNEQLLQRLEAQDQRGQQYIQTQEQQQAVQQFGKYFQETIDTYAQKVPDYEAAANFLHDSRRKELAAMGIGEQADQDQIMQQEALTIGAHAMQMGRNHAEIFYEMAKLRGYQPSAAPSTTKSKPPPTRLETVKKGQEAATSLSSMGGAGGDTELTAEALISMSDEEFQAATSGKKWKRLHGR